MIQDSFYLSQEENIEKFQELTGLCLDEIEHIVGRFSNNSWRKGQLRGEVVVFVDSRVIIRHHFNKKILWRQE